MKYRIFLFIGQLQINVFVVCAGDAPEAVRNLKDGISPEPKPDSGFLSARGHPLGPPIISWYCSKSLLLKVCDSIALNYLNLSKGLQSI